MQELRYKDVESGLVSLFGVPKNWLGAFRARIRHLRNIGVPELERVGSGTQLTYTRAQVLELVLAIELEQSGVTPRSVAKLAKFAAQAFAKKPSREKIYMIVLNLFAAEQMGIELSSLLRIGQVAEPIAFTSTTGQFVAAVIVRGTKTIRDMVQRWSRSGRLLFVVNVSQCNSELPPQWK